MLVSTKLIGGDLYVIFNGELDQSVAEKLRPQLDKLLSSNTCRRVIFDMSSLHFMDSTGVGLIMGRYRKLKENNVALYITKANPQIDKVLKISGLYNIIPVV